MPDEAGRVFDRSTTDDTLQLVVDVSEAKDSIWQAYLDEEPNGEEDSSRG